SPRSVVLLVSRRAQAAASILLSPRSRPRLRRLAATGILQGWRSRLPQDSRPRKLERECGTGMSLRDSERGKGQAVPEDVQQLLQWNSPAQGLALGTRLGLPLLQFERLRGAPSRGPVRAAAALSQVRGLNHLDLYQA